MKEAIIIFTRVPLPGKTKTRLQSMLSGYECAEIHKNFLKDLKNTCEKMGRDIFIFHTPIDKENIIVIYTTRTRYYTHKINNELATNRFMISSNGSKRYDVRNKKLYGQNI